MVAASGQKLTCTANDTDYTVTVVAGARYAITADATGVIWLGVADVTTDANILWAIGPGGTIGIEIPAGITTLHYGSDTDGAIGRLAQIDDTQ
jgi:hypothetical protein